MFKPIMDEREIGNILHGLTKDQIFSIIKSGPMMGILDVSCFIKRGGKAPIPSVISSKMIDCSFYYWNNIEDYMRVFLGDDYRDFFKSYDRKTYIETVIQLCEDNQLIFCFCIALFLEAQMVNFSASPYPVQNIVLQLLDPIFDETEFYNDYDSPGLFSGPNAKFYVTLHAGHHPFIQTNFPYQTLENWQNELEAAMALTIPQIVENSIIELPSPNNLFLKEIIRNEILVWQQSPPRIGEKSVWSWLPRIG